MLNHKLQNTFTNKKTQIGDAKASPDRKLESEVESTHLMSPTSMMYSNPSIAINVRSEVN